MLKNRFDKFFITVSFIFFVIFSQSLFGKVMLSDTAYLKQELSPKVNLIFSESFKNLTNLLYDSSSLFLEEYQGIFNTAVYKENSIVFVSPLTQAPNSFFRIYPLPIIQLYGPPFQVMDQLAINDWLLDSLSHELAHLYQLNSQKGFSHLLSHVLPPFSWLVYPNSYLHDVILEGNAVLLESIYGTGGRLFSGAARAFVFSQIKNNISVKRILNDYADPFSRSEKYLHGGHFYSYLLGKYSLSEINQIFKVNSENLLFPIGLYTINKTFKKVFQKSFNTLFREYISFYKPMAEKQVSSPEASFLTSRVSAPINSNDEQLFFLISDGKSPYQIVKIDKKTKQITYKESHIPFGKLFFLEGEYHSASFGKVSTLSSQFSLFKESFTPVKKYNSRYVMDIKGDNTLDMDSSQSFGKYRVYFNNQFVNEVNSSALMDDEGKVYYFKQKGEERWLYQNQTPLWKYKGYYGFPVDVLSSSVYFLAPTKYGSSLFVYKGGKVSRVSPSDSIVAARSINENEFLISEVNKDHFEYKIISIEEKKETPALYSYPFEKKTWPKKDSPPPETSVDSYHSVLNLKFKEATFFTDFGLLNKKDVGFFTFFSLEDPLEISQWLFLAYVSRSKQKINLKYRYRKYRSILEWGYQYKLAPLSFKNADETKKTLQALDDLKEDFIVRTLSVLLLNKEEVSHESHEARWGVKYPLWGREHWQIFASMDGILGKSRFLNDGNWNPYVKYKVNLSYKMNRQYSYAFESYKYLNLDFFYERLYRVEKQDLSHFYGMNFSLGQEIAEDVFVSTSGKWLSHTKRQGRIRPFKISQDAFFSFHTMSLIESVSDFFLTHFQIKKVLNHALYFESFPLSLRRWAPFLGVSSLVFKPLNQEGAFYQTFYYLFFGGEWELSLNYKAVAQLGWNGGYVFKKDYNKDGSKISFQNGVYLKMDF